MIDTGILIQKMDDQDLNNNRLINTGITFKWPVENDLGHIFELIQENLRRTWNLDCSDEELIELYAERCVCGNPVVWNHIVIDRITGKLMTCGACCIVD